MFTECIAAGFWDELEKIAEEKKKEPSLGKSLGIGAGVGAGLGAGITFVPKMVARNRQIEAHKSIQSSLEKDLARARESLAFVEKGLAKERLRGPLSPDDAKFFAGGIDASKKWEANTLEHLERYKALPVKPVLKPTLKGAGIAGLLGAAGGLTTYGIRQARRDKQRGEKSHAGKVLAGGAGLGAAGGIVREHLGLNKLYRQELPRLKQDLRKTLSHVPDTFFTKTDMTEHAKYLKKEIETGSKVLRYPYIPRLTKRSIISGLLGGALGLGAAGGVYGIHKALQARKRKKD